MNKQEIIDYVMNTPHNVNRTILSQGLDEIGAQSDSSGNVDLAITGATVGQTVKISAVDENGVPTAWESVDFPSGGGRI